MQVLRHAMAAPPPTRAAPPPAPPRRFKPSAEWDAMMASVQGELQEAAQRGESPLVDAAAAAAPADGTATEQAAQRPRAEQDAAMGEAEPVAGDGRQW